MTDIAKPEIRRVAGQWVLYADDRPLIWRVEEKLPYDRANVLRVLRMRETVEFRSGPFDCWRLRLEFSGTRIHWTDFDHWGRRIRWTVDTDYDMTVRVLECFLEHGDPLVEAGRLIEQALSETDDARRLVLLNGATRLLERVKGGDHDLG